MKEIHFICPNRILLTLIERPDDASGAWVYESGNWDLRPDEPALLVGGIIYLHQTKATPSYFGGPTTVTMRLMSADALATRWFSDLPRLPQLRMSNGAPSVTPEGRTAVWSTCPRLSLLRIRA